MTKEKRNKILHIFLWVVQAMLAFVFISAGYTKTFQPVESLVASMPWVADAPSALVRFIGISEILGAIGLILPSLLKIQPKLTVHAAIGLLTIMVLAAALHVYRGEFDLIGFSIIFAILCGFITWGRLKKAPIYPRH